MSDLLMKLLGRTYRADDPEDTGSGGDAELDVELDDLKAKRGDILEEDNDDDDDDEKLEAKTGEDEAGDSEEDEQKKTISAKKPTSVPIGRFNEAQRKSREREAVLNATIEKMMKDGSTRAQEEDVEKLETNIATLEEQYNDHMKDGDTKEALDTMRQIRKAEREVMSLMSDKRSSHAQAMAVEEVRVDFIIKDLEERYSILDPESDDYDDDVVGLISAARKGYEADGLSSSAALEKAGREVLRRMQPVAADTGVEVKKGLGADKVDSQKSKQIRKNIDAKLAQGASLDVIGSNSDKKGGGSADSKSAMDMTDEDLEALPASTLKKLRGDFVTEAGT